MNSPIDPKQDQAKAGGGAQPGAYPLDRYTVAPKQNEGEGEKSPYYKSAAPSISMPKGGGALKGIDEKFSVNAVNGTSSLQVGLPLTPGRGGFTLALSLSYNSGSGNSEFGLGWSLSLPAIQRRTDKKLPLYDDAGESDVFLLAGAEDLQPALTLSAGTWVPDIVTSGSYTSKRYRPRIEGLFARIEHITKTGRSDSWWKVTTKENIVTFYGLTAEGRISDPQNPNRIFKWLPQMSYDNKGNVQQFFYKPEDNANVTLYAHEANRLNGNAPYTNTYLKSVAYCNLKPFMPDDDNCPSLPPSPEGKIGTPMSALDRGYLMQAVFDYGDHDPAVPAPYDTAPSWPCRIDAFSDFHAGFETRTYRKCRRVLMFHYFEEIFNGSVPVLPAHLVPSCLVRSLDFVYEHDTSGAVFAEADFITKITQTGYLLQGGSYLSKSLPPMTMQYQPLQWDNTIHDVSREDAQNAPQGLTGNYQWLDLWGEGLPGILYEHGNGWFYKRNRGDGHFDPALEIAPKPSLVGLGANLQWEDLDADGRRHLVSRDPALPGYYELDDEQQWQPFRTFKEWANVDWNSPYTKVLDLNGDGRPDVLITEERAWRWYENEGTDGYAIGGEASNVYDEEKGPRLLVNDMMQAIFLADMNGDGMTDIVRIQNGEVCYWPNMGYGRFGAKVAMTNAPFFDRPDIFNPIYITLADISGTGAADLIYVGQNKCTAWINCAGNAWGDATDILPLPAINAQTRITVTDFLGSGTASIVWSSPDPLYANAPMRYIDLMGGFKPYLMTSHSNGMGKTTTVAYKHSTQYYLDDMFAGKPWATRLPFPVHCVSEVTTADSVSQTSYTQLYTYHHGYYDHAEREFRGFGRVESTDTDTAIAFSSGTTENDLDQYPVLTKTWYHTGAWMQEGTLEEAFATEYFPLAWAELPLAPSLPAGLTAQEQRECYRALKGQALRQEVYGLDGSTQQGVPYTVATHSYCVQQVQPVDGNMYGSFFSYAQQSLSFSCERNAADPRVTHQLVLAVDQYGNVLESVNVAYPRVSIPSGTPSQVGIVQSTMLATYAATGYTNDILTGGYHLRLPCEVASYELTGLPAPTPSALLTIAGLQSAISAATKIEFAATPGTSGVYMRLLSLGRVLYLSDDTTTPLALGTIQSLGLGYNHYQMAFSNGILTDANYYNGQVTTDMLHEGGYLLYADIPISSTTPCFPATDSSNYPGCAWLPGGTVQYSTMPANDFYSPVSYKDPWGNATTVTYWNNSSTNYYLLPQSVTDAVSNVSTVNAYNWYNLQPVHITDINNNESKILFDILGMPVAAAVMSKDGSTEGDSIAGIDPADSTDLANQAAFFADPHSVAAALLQNASWRCVYDLSASPVVVGMIARQQHALPVVASPDTTLLIRLTYTDGLGRIAMHKVQAAPAEGDTTIRWIGSGKTIYNNKGSVVMQYEPYYTITPAYDDAIQAAMYGLTPRVHYDPLGRGIRTDLPDGSYTKTDWDSWMQTAYDNNDTVASSTWYTAALAGTPEQVDAANKAFQHNNTPTIIHFDTLARPFYTLLQNRHYDTGSSTWVTDTPYATYVVLDIEGDRLQIEDARSLTPLTHTYSMLKAVVREVSIDSGTKKMLQDAAGAHLYSWDADNRMFHFTYDVLRRQLTRQVTLSGSATPKVLEVNVYGEGQPSDTVHNLRGTLYQIYDGAGTEIIPDYDFKGNPLTFQRTFVNDYTQVPDWTTPGSVTMESTTYNEAQTYDALGRTLTITTPDTGVTTYAYELTGMLFSIQVSNVGSDGASSPTYSLTSSIINAVYYDAHFRRIKVKYENGATTVFSYDPNTFRITEIKTTRSSDNAILQDLLYWYDPVGNITTQKDAAQQTVYFNGTVVSPNNSYTYDALYRLNIAQGREHAGNNAAPTYNDSSRSQIAPEPVSATDTAAMRTYIQYYKYDYVGNITEMKHTVTGGMGNWTRDYTIDTATNRLTGTSIGSNNPIAETYSYDSRGNMISGMNHLTSLTYNEENELQKVIDASGNITTYYQYNYQGKRVRKTTIDTGSGITKARRYFGYWEQYQNITTGISVITLQRETLSIMDNSERIALIDTPTINTTSSGEVQLLRYQFSNHLSTAALELDASAAIVSYEEYYPYGSTSFQSGRSLAEVSLKRYRFTAKEKDDESGFYYHGARYYVPWLARWIAADPLEANFSPESPYNYGNNNPITWQDPTGTQVEKKKDDKKSDDKKKDDKKGDDKKKDDKKKDDKKKDDKKKDDKKKDDKKKQDQTQHTQHTQEQHHDSPNKEQQVKVQGHSQTWEQTKATPSPQRPTDHSPFTAKMLEHINKTEAGYVDNKKDPGGKTKYGIAEHREWTAFASYIGISSDTSNIKNITAAQADSYYVHSRFDPLRIDRINNEKVANALFDQSVPTPGIVNKNMRKALSDLGYGSSVSNNSNLTYREIKSVNAVNADSLTNHFVKYQEEHYESIKNSNPKNYKEHIKGWKNRLNSLKNY